MYNGGLGRWKEVVVVVVVGSFVRKREAGEGVEG
jgi:hypothetical protein